MMYGRPKNRYRWVIQGLLITAQLCIGINVLAPAPLFPLIMEEYGLERASVSILVVVMALMIAVGNVPSGILAAKYGIYRTFAAGSLLMSAGIFAPFMPNFLGHIIWRVVFAFGVGLVIPLVGAIGSQWFDRKELPLVNGTNWMGQIGGMSLSMFIAVPIASSIGWEYTLSIFGCVALVGALAWLILGKGQSTTNTVPVSPGLSELLSVLKEKTTILISLALIGPLFAYLTLMAWLPTYYNEVFGFDLARAGMTTALAPLAGVIASPVSGILSMKLGLRKPFLIGSGFLFILCTFGTFSINDIRIIHAAIIGLGISMWVFFPMIFNVATELPDKSATQIAVILSAGLFVGNLSSLGGPLLVGITTDSLGTYIPSFTILALMPVLMIIASILIPETGPRGITALPTTNQDRSMS